VSPSAQRRCAQCARELRGCLLDALFCETCEDRHDAERAEAECDEDEYESCPGYRED